ncbi:MFS transporter, DHA1 family, bicyclomycin/chloramphenicol resistance protein [Paenibacillus sp. 1_12]|uniref:Bcr/CflA family multidrug efflux MFS transporter n=1 Tax=Paenibacillus sp. 1_12 TaxID=1566278 RepID=UPI0008ED85A1|nr:Bcr/CflA family multidrug efflux MFS transporter [Paenibacillus sp. 1_12]SFK81865.1 MFS transporter, DHA1 family, bicyclomycin/chloramphenicol resistance protein [Paenibacillus sp. 1_12]
MNSSINTAKAAPQPVARGNRLWMVLVLGSLAAFAPLSIDMYLPALPAIAGEYSTSASLVQLSLTFFLLGSALGQLFAGPISDVRGRRMPLLIGLALYALTSLLCAFSPSVESLIVLRFVQGLAGSAGIVISRAIVRDLYSGTELTKFFTLLMLVNGVAPILAPIAGGQLMRVTSWHGVFIVLCVLGIVMLAAVFFGLRETLPNQMRSKGGIGNTLSTFRGLLVDRVFMGYAIAQGLVFAAMFAYISGSPFVLQEIFLVSPQMFAVFFGINGLGIIIAGQITGRLVGRLGETKLLIAGLGISSCGGVLLLLMIVTGAGLYAILPALFMVVSSVGIVSSTGFSLAMQNQSKSAGTASALLGVLSLLLGGVVAPLVGLGGSQSAVPMGLVIACTSVGSVLVYVFMVRRKASTS